MWDWSCPVEGNASFSLWLLPWLVWGAEPPDQREFVRATGMMKENWFDCSGPAQVSGMDPTEGKASGETTPQLECGIWSMESSWCPCLLLPAVTSFLISHQHSWLKFKLTFSGPVSLLIPRSACLELSPFLPFNNKSQYHQTATPAFDFHVLVIGEFQMDLIPPSQKLPLVYQNLSWLSEPTIPY